MCLVEYSVRVRRTSTNIIRIALLYDATRVGGMIQSILVSRMMTAEEQVMSGDTVKLPDGTNFEPWEPTATFSKTHYVSVDPRS